MERGGKRPRFFYGYLLDGVEQSPARGDDDSGFDPRLIDNVISAFGVRRWLAALDSGNSFDRGGILGSVLTFVSGEGFGDHMARHSQSYDSAHEFRNRILISGMKAKGRG